MIGPASYSTLPLGRPSVPPTPRLPALAKEAQAAAFGPKASWGFYLEGVYIHWVREGVSVEGRHGDRGPAGDLRERYCLRALRPSSTQCRPSTSGSEAAVLAQA